MTLYKLLTNIPLHYNEIKSYQTFTHALQQNKKIATKLSVCSLVGFSQGLSASQQCFPLITNQHQPGLSAQKPSSEQALFSLSLKFKSYSLLLIGVELEILLSTETSDVSKTLKIY